MIIWKEIDTVLLDMDGTLLDLHFDNYFWQEYLPLKWGELNNLDLETAKDALMPGFSQRTGTLAWYCIDNWSAHLGLDILALKADIVHMIRERPGAIEFLKFLDTIGKNKVMVTNAHSGLIIMKFQRTGLGKHFRDVFCAHDFGHPKEEQEFWHALKESYPFDPDRTLLVDDNTSVLDSAREFGIRHLLSIAQPDLSKPRRDAGGYPVIESFTDLMVSEQE